MQKTRITSIDALRAVTLLGIIIVHTLNGFGFKYELGFIGLDKFLASFIKLFLSHKCNTIFSLLFGISFYLILRNPSNSTSKFVWRCFLLMIIGIFNKFFYTYDALMWYGLCGICLAPIRYLKPRNIFLVFIFLTLMRLALRPYHIGNLIWGEASMSRYGADFSLTEIISYPSAIIDYLRIVFNAGIFGTLSLFVLGYWFARIGVIDNLKDNVTNKAVFIFWLLYISSFGLFYLFGKNSFLSTFNNYMATFAYSSTIIYLYYHAKSIRSVLEKLEPYGKLGLTNYSMSSICGVLLMGAYGLNLCHKSLFLALIIFLIFYLIQAIFSFYWIKYFRYGPMEYVWRVLTERKFIELKK